MIQVQNGTVSIWVCQNCSIDHDVSGVDPETRCFVCGTKARRWFLRQNEVPEYVISQAVYVDAYYDRSGPSSVDVSWPPPIDPS